MESSLEEGEEEGKKDNKRRRFEVGKPEREGGSFKKDSGELWKIIKNKPKNKSQNYSRIINEIKTTQRMMIKDGWMVEELTMFTVWNENHNWREMFVFIFKRTLAFWDEFLFVVFFSLNVYFFVYLNFEKKYNFCL